VKYLILDNEKLDENLLYFTVRLS